MVKSSTYLISTLSAGAWAMQITLHPLNPAICCLGKFHCRCDFGKDVMFRCMILMVFFLFNLTCYSSIRNWH